MRRTVRFVLVMVGVAVMTLFAAAVAYAGPGDVIGTKHNLGSAGNPACLVCHTPHDAKGSYLWARNVGSGSGLKPLCYSCHDGTVTNTGSYAFDATKYQHPVTPGSKGQDCDRCHNPHSNTWKFLTLSQTNADLCTTCHGKSGSNNHPIDVLADKWPPTDQVWDPKATPTPDFSGTRLWDSAGTTVVTTGSGYVKCLTCHNPHGASTNTLNTMPTSSATDGSSPLCQNCHK
ncbi:MAG: hypothetical protein M0T85_02935 [Dehalococcoidales bacterium]|nr:hypothetical protein [Dehalococcoidales bacterium]